MTLTPLGRNLLWIGSGGFIGLAVGGLFVAPDRALSLSPVWVVALAVFVGIVIGVTRTRPPRAARASSPKAVAARAPPGPPGTSLQVRFEFPDVPSGYPIVLGRGEPIQVRVRVSGDNATHAEGAAIQFSAAMDGETLSEDGLTGSEGEVEFTLEPESPGEIALVAEARSAASTGRASSVVSVVNYEDEIERLFGEFREYAATVLGPEAHSDTARELCDKLRPRADASTARALLELARVYELVAYGERAADRRLYLAVLEQLMLLEHASLPAPGDTTATTTSSSLSREA